MRLFAAVTVRARALASAALLAGAVGVTFVPAFWRIVYPIHYLPEIRRASSRAHVDPLLVAALVRVESHFREDDVSHAGAIGLMQLMPRTAFWIAAKIRTPFHSARDLSEPDLNLRLGTWYIAYLLRMFHGRLPEAVAAYNAGPNQVMGWLRRGVWSGDEVSIEDIPVRETRHFVARVLYTERVFHRFYR